MQHVQWAKFRQRNEIWLKGTDTNMTGINTSRRRDAVDPFEYHDIVTVY